MNLLKKLILKKLFEGNSIAPNETLKTSVFRSYQNIGARESSKIEHIQKVLNVGAVVNEGDKEGRLYKDYFPNADFFALDKSRSIKDKNQLKMDLHDLAKLDQKFDLVLCMSVLEHVENPFKVAEELKATLNKGGYLYVAVPFFYPEHKDVKRRWSDYWRFTDDALRVLFSDMTEIWINRMPHSVRVVNDRKLYWDKPELATVGFYALFQKKL